MIVELRISSEDFATRQMASFMLMDFKHHKFASLQFNFSLDIQKQFSSVVPVEALDDSLAS